VAQKLCVCLTGSTIQAQLSTAREYQTLAHLYETRLDFLFSTEASSFLLVSDLVLFVNQLLQLGRPVILTARHRKDGGVWPGDKEAWRMSILVSLAKEFSTNGKVYIDLDWGVPELDALAKELVNASLGVLRSIHSFDSSWTPKDLEERGNGLFEAVEGEARRFIPKIALACEGIAQTRAIFRFGQEKRARGFRSFLVLGMGEYGLATRVLTQWIGSEWTYSTPLQGGPAAAPGQLDPRTLEEVYGYSNLKGTETLFGILGNPLSHSKSPQFHNDRFRSVGFPGVYLPFRTDDLAAGRQLMDDLGVKGLSVTIPHKEGVISWLVDRDDGVAAVGACNTLVRTDRGWKGYNSDIPGFLAPLAHQKGLLRALVLGAGGAARAIVFGLGKMGIEVTVTNRTPQRAQELNEELQPYLPTTLLNLDWTQAPSTTGWDLIVQTTSVGMDGKSDPFDLYEWTGKEVAYDLIYTPEQTPFLLRAQRAGCITINGWPMFEGQGQVQSRLFRRLTPGFLPDITCV